MSLTRQVPERYEHGHWHVAEAHDDGNGLTLPPNIGGGWCATYAEIGGTTWAVFRSVEPKDVPDAPHTVQEVLDAAAAQGVQSETKKHAWRVGGV